MSLSTCLHQLVSINLSPSTCLYQLVSINLSPSTCLYQLVSIYLSLSTWCAAAALRSRRSTWWLSVLPGGLWTPLTPRLLCVAGAALGDSLEDCLTPLAPRLVTLWRAAWRRWRRWRCDTPRLSPVAGAALGDSLEDCLTLLMPLMPLTPLTRQQTRHLVTLWRKLDAVGAIDAAAVSRRRRGYWWLSRGLLDANDAAAVPRAAVDAAVVLCGRRGSWWLSGARAAWCRWRRSCLAWRAVWRRWRRWRHWRRGCLPWQARHLVTLGSLEDFLTLFTPLTPRLSCVAGAALGDFLEGWAGWCRWRGWHQAAPHGRRGTWCLTLCMEGSLTLLTPLAPRLSFVADAAIGDFLAGCSMPLTPRLSRVAGAALGDSLALTPLTPRLVTLWRAAWRGWCCWRRWRRRCLAWHALYFWPLGGELPLTPLTPRLSRVAWCRGWWLSCLAGARLGDALEGCSMRLTPLTPPTRGTWWLSAWRVAWRRGRRWRRGCSRGRRRTLTPWRAAWCRWRRWRRWRRGCLTSSQPRPLRDSLESCSRDAVDAVVTLLMPLTPRLSRMAGAALGDSREGCLTRSPRLSHAAGAAPGDSLEGCLTSLAPLTPRLFLVAGLALGGFLGGLLDAVALGDFVESCLTPSAPSWTVSERVWTVLTVSEPVSTVSEPV